MPRQPGVELELRTKFHYNNDKVEDANQSLSQSLNGSEPVNFLVLTYLKIA